MAGESVTPHGLNPSHGIRTIWKLAATQIKQNGDEQYRLYVIEVTESETVKFYVGHTGHTVEHRFKQHQSRDKEQNSANIFRRNRGTAAKLRYDLFEGLPYFTERDTATMAEGVLADVNETQLKAGVECDVLRSRKKKRTAAEGARGKTAKKAAPKKAAPAKKAAPKKATPAKKVVPKKAAPKKAAPKPVSKSTNRFVWSEGDITITKAPQNLDDS